MAAVFVCACIWLRSYTGHYACMGCYNRELSARWSFGGAIFKGVLVSRGCHYSACTVLHQVQCVSCTLLTKYQPWIDLAYIHDIEIEFTT